MRADALCGVSSQSWAKFADRQPNVAGVVDAIANNVPNAQYLTTRDVGQARYTSLFVYNTLRDSVQRKALDTLVPITFADPNEWY